MPEELPNREVYRRSGRFHPLLLPIAFAIGSIGALVAGLFLMFCFQVGFYLLVIMPLLGGAIASSAVLFAVHFGKCRNRFLGGFLGLLAGTIAYASYYQFDMAYNFSRDPQIPGFQPPSFWELAPRVDVLPHYVELRLRSDRVGKAGEEQDEQIHQAGQPKPEGNDPQQLIRQTIPFMNWATFALDVILIVLPPIVIGAGFANRPFAEGVKRWMKTHTVVLPPADNARLIAAIREDNPRKLMEEEDVAPIANPGNAVFYFVPNSPDAPVFLNLTLVQPHPQPGGVAVQFALFYGVRLTPEEVAILAQKLKIPGLAAT